jgi:hypothetical protein
MHGPWHSWVDATRWTEMMNCRLIEEYYAQAEKGIITPVSDEVEGVRPQWGPHKRPRKSRAMVRDQVNVE